MVISDNGNTLNPIANVTPAERQAGSASKETAAQTVPPTVDRVTVSNAGAGIAQAAGEADVRWEKVAAVQKALADGTYDVPASAVAASMVDAMLGKRG